MEDPRDYVPTTIIYVFFVIQAFDAKYISLLVQTIAYSLFKNKTGKCWENMLVIVYAFFSVL